MVEGENSTFSPPPQKKATRAASGRAKKQQQHKPNFCRKFWWSDQSAYFCSFFSLGEISDLGYRLALSGPHGGAKMCMRTLLCPYNDHQVSFGYVLGQQIWIFIEKYYKSSQKVVFLEGNLRCQTVFGQPQRGSAGHFGSFFFRAAEGRAAFFCVFSSFWRFFEIFFQKKTGRKIGFFWPPRGPLLKPGKKKK